MPQVSSTDRHSAIIVTFAPSSVRWHLNPTFITSTNQLLPNVKSHWNVLICAGIEYGFRNTEYERQLKYAGSFWYSVKRNCRKTLYKRLNKSTKDICLIGASNNMCCQVFEHKTKSPSWTDWKLWRGCLHCICISNCIWKRRPLEGALALYLENNWDDMRPAINLILESHFFVSSIWRNHLRMQIQNTKYEEEKTQFNQQRWEWLY